MKNKRTQEQINSAIERLLLNRQNCREINLYGHDNHKNIDAIIDVIQNNRTETYITKKYEKESNNGLFDSAMYGLKYLNNEISLEDLLHEEVKLFEYWKKIYNTKI